MTSSGGAAAIALVLLTCAWTGLPAAASNGIAGSQCRAGERVVYNCRASSKLTSVCLGTDSIHYRSGSRGGADIDVASTADWSNIHLGGNRSQAGLSQDHVRFSSQDTHYVVHAGQTGSLNERPGRRYSGIVILQGDSADHEIGSLDCKGTPFDYEAFTAISASAPEGWSGREIDGGPFDVIY